MVASPAGEDHWDRIQTTLAWITQVGIDGRDGILPDPGEVATERLKNAASLEDAVNSVIAWRANYASGSGFIAEVTRIAAMPVYLPASAAASYAAAVNTAAAIAYLRGYDIHSDWVKTLILLCLLEVGDEVLQAAGSAIDKTVSPTLLEAINQQIGFRLMTDLCKKGRVCKLVPLSGGLVGVPLDVALVSHCGRAAKTRFIPERLARTSINLDARSLCLKRS